MLESPCFSRRISGFCWNDRLAEPDDVCSSGAAYLPQQYLHDLRCLHRTRIYRTPLPVAGFFESLFSKSGDVDSIDSEIIQAASSRGQWDAAFDMSGATVTALSADEKTGTSFPFRITFEGVFVLSVSVIDACDKDSPQRSLFLTANTAESRWEVLALFVQDWDWLGFCNYDGLCRRCSIRRFHRREMRTSLSITLVIR